MVMNTLRHEEAPRDMTIDEYIAVREQAADDKHGLKSRIARDLGISAAFLSQILNRKRTPSSQMMIQIAVRTAGTVSMESWVRREAHANAADQ